MHGVPPKDYPKQELAEFFSLHGRFQHSASMQKSPQMERYLYLSEKMKKWPRSEQNDPFYSTSQELAQRLSLETGNEVMVGYMEFCAPEAMDVLEEAAKCRPDSIVVVTPMMTRGGDHSEVEIPAVVKRFQERHPEIKVIYAWPFSLTDIARFLARQITNFVD
jgi:sirohydrochlorin cobaltochelatase